MAEPDWERVVRKPEELCAISGERFEANEEVVTILVLEDDGFHRKDIKAAYQDRVEGEVFSFWRWRRARELKPNSRRLDLGFLTEFFKRLDGRDEAQAARVKWIVALLLLRKKLLEEVDRGTDDEGHDVLELRFKKTERVYSVKDRGLDAEAMASIEDDLGRIFNLQTAPKGEGNAAPEPHADPDPDPEPEQSQT